MQDRRVVELGSRVIRILCVEDNASDARWLQECLKSTEPSRFDALFASSLEEARPILARGAIEVILLDLNLADSSGLDTLRAVAALAPHAGIVVTTGIGDEDVAISALQMGAQDYLMKGSYDARALSRSIIYAFVRQELAQISAARKKESEKEMASLHKMYAVPKTRKSSEQNVRLREREGPLFQAAVETFVDVVAKGLEEQELVVDHGVSETTARLAATLAEQGAGPRDVVDVYSAAVRHLESRSARPSRLSAELHEARIRSLELMGNLADRYRGQVELVGEKSR